MKINPTVRDLNARIQDGLDRGDKLELVICKDGIMYLKLVGTAIEHE